MNVTVRGTRPPPARRLVVLIAVAAFGCGGDESPGPDLTAIPDELTLTPVVRIDGYAENLVPIGRTALRRDGLLALTQPQDGTVLFYAPDGTRVGAFGREGQGPGEFAGISDLGWIADTLWVSDFRQSRLTFVAVDPDPRLLRSESWSSVSPTTAGAGLPVFRRASPVAPWPDGTLLARLIGPEGDPPELEGVTILGRVGMDGTLLGEVARWSDPPEGVTSETREGQTITRSFMISNPWSIRTLSAHPGSPDGFVVVRTEVLPEDRVALHLARFDGGATVSARTLTFQGIPITRATADSAIEARAAGISDEFNDSWADLDLRDYYRQNATVPPVFPPARQVVPGPDGTVWLVTGGIEGLPERSHLVLDAADRLVGRVTLAGGTVVEVGRDVAWVSVSDSLGVQSLVRYRVGGG